MALHSPQMCRWNRGLRLQSQLYTHNAPGHGRTCARNSKHYAAHPRTQWYTAVDNRRLRPALAMRTRPGADAREHSRHANTHDTRARKDLKSRVKRRSKRVPAPQPSSLPGLCWRTVRARRHGTHTVASQSCACARCSCVPPRRRRGDPRRDPRRGGGGACSSIGVYGAAACMYGPACVSRLSSKGGSPAARRGFVTCG